MVTVSSRARTSRTVAVWRVPRTRGALSGVLLVLLGVWGGLVPFIGPHFNYAFGPDATWTMTWGRLWLETVPAAATVLGGVLLAGSASRVAGLWASWLAALAGAWFVVGPSVSRLFFNGQSQTGAPLPGPTTMHTVIEEVGIFYGLGAVIVFLAATALGRFSVIGVREHEAVVAEREVAQQELDEREAAREPVAGERGTETMPTQDEAERARLADERTARIHAENAEANRGITPPEGYGPNEGVAGSGQRTVAPGERAAGTGERAVGPDA